MIKRRHRQSALCIQIERIKMFILMEYVNVINILPKVIYNDIITISIISITNE